MAASFGIHLGCTSFCLAADKDGKTDVVANDAGDRVTPAIVAFTDHDQAVGLPAKQGLVRNAQNTVVNVKQFIGCTYEEVEKSAVRGSVSVVNKNDLPVFEVMFKEATKQFSPEDITQVLFRKMLDIARSQGGNGSHDAVLAVPVHFTEKHVQCLSKCAHSAGFVVLRCISEPAAALLAYDIGQSSPVEPCNVVVYRLGGLSLDVSVVSVNGGMYRLLSTTTDTSIGGDSFTQRLVDHFADEFKRLWKCDARESKRSITKLHIAADMCKHILSSLPTSQCSVDSLHEGIDFQCTISRSRFDGLCGDIVQKCVLSIDGALAEAGVKKENIHKVIICGGSTKMPCLQQQLRDYFPSAELLNNLSPDEVIAIGAAKQAAILKSYDLDEITKNNLETEVPCLSRELLVEVDGHPESTRTVFQKYTPIPVRKQEHFQLNTEQTSITILILEGCNNAEPRLLAKVSLDELPAGSSVTGVFHFRSDGSLHATCTEHKCNRSASVTIETS